MNSHFVELEIIHWIQQYRSPLGDVFFRCLDYFDRPVFFFILIPAFWLGKGWKTGLKLFYIIFLSGLANQTLKAFFAAPRPLHIDPEVGLIPLTTYGFPSGAAQTVIILAGLLLYFGKRPWKWPLAFCYIFLISFSRIYLGVHFPTDILGGWAIGFALWALFVYVFPKLEVKLQKCSVFSLFLLSQAIPLSLLFFSGGASISFSACGAGIGIGLLINHLCKWTLPHPRTTKESLLRAMIGVIGTLACYLLIFQTPLPHLPFIIFFQFLLLSLAMTTASLLLCRKLLYRY